MLRMDAIACLRDTMPPAAVRDVPAVALATKTMPSAAMK
jgi:hypothetical protein